jgi:hypothetical protein
LLHDTVLGYGDDEDLIVINETLEKYEKASGAKVNKEKSIGLKLGKFRNQKYQNQGRSLNIPWAKEGQQIKYLGTYVGINIDRNINWNNIIDKIQGTAKVWLNRYLSVYGKVLIVKTLMLSKL